MVSEKYSDFWEEMQFLQNLIKHVYKEKRHLKSIVQIFWVGFNKKVMNS